MEEIKVNDFVRTKEGYIAKLIHYGINKGINGKSCLFDRAIRDISDSVYDECGQRKQQGCIPSVGNPALDPSHDQADHRCGKICRNRRCHVRRSCVGP